MTSVNNLTEKFQIYKEYLELKDAQPDYDFSDDDYTEDDIKELLEKSHLNIGKIETKDKLALVSGILDQAQDANLVKILFWLDIPKICSLEDIYQIFRVIENGLPENTALDYSLSKTRTEDSYVMKYIMWLQGN